MTQGHHFLKQSQNRLDIMAMADILLFHLDEPAVVLEGDLISFDDLTVTVNWAQRTQGKHNWRAMVYGDDVGRLRERLT